MNNCPVPILQDEWEFNTFLNLYKSFAPKVVIEIGSFYGGTLWHWIKYNPTMVHLISIDLSIGPEDGRYQEMIEAKRKWQEWVGETLRVDFIEGSSHSHDVIKKIYDMYPFAEVDMLFIDGDHAYSSVMKDWNLYHKLVRPGGWVVFHDIFGIGDVNRAWTEIKKSHDSKTIEISIKNGGWGIGIIEI